MKEKISVGYYAMAIPLAFVQAWLACALYVLVAVLWLIRDRRVEQTMPARGGLC